VKQFVFSGAWFIAIPLRGTKCAHPRKMAGKWMVADTQCRIGDRAEAKGEGTMQPEAISRRMDAVATHSLANVLDCPAATGSLLSGSARRIDYEEGEVVFRQSEICKGLYVIVSGRFLRKTERLQMRLALGQASAGELVELAAVLGSGQHNYTLSAQTPGAVLLLPTEALNQAFESYPQLRMQLLEELAREVSRAYYACHSSAPIRSRRQHSGAAVA
jgi:hypothetical protein